MTTMPDWRQAVPGDASALVDLERDANVVALAHVFPPEEYPFPEAEVRAEWVAKLAADEVVVEVVDGPGRLEGFLVYDATRLRQLAVHPDSWGTGLGRSGVERAAAYGATLLWCLAANHRARAFYERLGWRTTGVTRQARWPPHPEEVEYAWNGPGRGPDAPPG